MGADASVDGEAAAAFERIGAALGEGAPVAALDEADMQTVLALAIAWFGARYEADRPAAAIAPRVDAPTTAAMVTASAILKCCEVELFELGLWQTFTGQN